MCGQSDRIKVRLEKKPQQDKYHPTTERDPIGVKKEEVKKARPDDQTDGESQTSQERWGPRNQWVRDGERMFV